MNKQCVNKAVKSRMANSRLHIANRIPKSPSIDDSHRPNHTENLRLKINFK